MVNVFNVGISCSSFLYGKIAANWEKEEHSILQVVMFLTSISSCSRAALGSLGSRRKRVAIRSREMVLLLFSAVMRRHLEFCILVPGSPVQDIQGHTGLSLANEHKGYQGFGSLDLWGEMLTLFSLQKRKLGGNVIGIYKYFMGGWTDGARLFMVVSYQRRRGSGGNWNNRDSA